ncbi:TonB-dependent receptor [Novosphingobium resinovorum]|uniref:TonB-dependent receptor n=1 Tax=Novosphingobium resinovorum TaxID=158500 RepID=A0A031K4V0_9SPHN|nr:MULTISPECIES: TonB-dependent receptor [Novosphingobium]AOR75964.1 TonB-dependent receptor [Novosphingobium resinovorum]EZP84976.1 TonB-dependent receptor [Novosphingobium resinovorum]MBF7011343.1 TonB-dependent receptor [Novosphingobium sp. HR1a]WJM29325.1 TonB-dependent receptor [Novosphingobium resinovorum]
MTARPPRIALLACASLVATVAADPALAQSVPGASGQEAFGPATASKSGHAQESGPEIIVTGRVISGNADPISAPVVLTGDALTRNLKPQIGDMLKSLPGVTSSGFAPGVSRPILRGFDGPRVQVLLDGLGSLDASAVSADHAVSLDTLNIERVEVLHGPRVLLYASDPAGGAVNALDKRIPRAVPDKAFTIDALGSYGTAANDVNGGVAANVRLADKWVAHLDASYYHSDDLHVGGYVLSPELRAETLASADALAADGDAAGAANLTAQAGRKGKLANSGTEGWTYGGGVAFIDAGGDIGVSAQRVANDYGIPPRPSTDPSSTMISLRQTRVDLRAGLNLDGFLKRLELRGAYGDYTHAEITDGAVGTRFNSQSLSARLQADQTRRGIWSGSSGVQYSSSTLDITGDELLLPNTETNRFAAFTLQQLEVGRFDLEAALRYENTQIRAKPNGGDLLTGQSRQFDQYSAVVGAAWHPTDTLTLSVNYQHGERAPSAEELFVNGAHDATQSFEVGNPNFTLEKSDGIEAGIRYSGSNFAGSVTAYGTNFGNFIAAVPTGQIDAESSLPIYQYLQAAARFRGIEAEGALTVARTQSGGTFKIDSGVDYTHARLVNLGPVPRIPPLRVRGGLEYDSPVFDLRGEVEWNARQNRVAENENPTDAFTLVNLSATWRPVGEKGPLTLILSANNLLDASGRLAASQTKDFVPIAGRDVRLTARITY